MGSSLAGNAKEWSIPRRGSYPKVECESTNVRGEYPRKCGDKIIALSITGVPKGWIVADKTVLKL
jgi:hypothetical protein